MAEYDANNNGNRQIRKAKKLASVKMTTHAVRVQATEERAKQKQGEISNIT